MHSCGNLQQIAPGRRKLVIRTAHVAFFTVVLLCVAANCAIAQSIEAARAAFDEGRFLEAAEIAGGLGTAQALTLANLSLVTYGYYLAEDDDEQGFYLRAMALGEQAVELDAGDAESNLRWAQAMGRYAQTIGNMRALREGYGGRIREGIEGALAFDPELAMAHISLAAWHAEGVKAGFVARTVLGASRKKAREHYERGLELGPDQKDVVFEYARGLVVLDERKNREKARAMYLRAREIPALNASDRLLDERTLRKLAKLDG